MVDKLIITLVVWIGPGIISAFIYGILEMMKLDKIDMHFYDINNDHFWCSALIILVGPLMLCLYLFLLISRFKIFTRLIFLLSRIFISKKKTYIDDLPKMKIHRGDLK